MNAALLLLVASTIAAPVPKPKETADHTDLALTNVRSTHGLGGPERQNDTLAPGDVLILSFDIEGVHVDDDGKVRYSMGFEATDSKGKVHFRANPRDLEATASLGGSSVPSSAPLIIGLDTKPDFYQFKVQVKDLVSGKEQRLTRTILVLPKDFALVRVTASADADGQYPMAFVASGSKIWAKCSAVAFERDRVGNQPNVVFEMRVLNEAGKPTLPNPATKTVNKGIPAKDMTLPIAFPLTLNRPGNFTIELQATDQISGKKTKASFPITVFSTQKPPSIYSPQNPPIIRCSPMPPNLCPVRCWSMRKSLARRACRPCWR
jgi:hypothetical protein